MTEKPNPSAPISDTLWTPGRVRTAKEARELLEELRSSYRSLTPGRREDVKNFISNLAESQRRFGSTLIDIERSFPERTF